MDGSGEDQMIVSGSGEVQMRVKSQKYSELDISGRETCSPQSQAAHDSEDRVSDVLRSVTN